MSKSNASREPNACDSAVDALLSDVEASSGFRNDLRRARESCERDAEAFDEVLFSLERLGCYLLGSVGDLGKYKCSLTRLVAISGSCHPAIEGLLTSVIQSRNDALHQGAVARHLSSRVVELSLILEDALVSRATKIEHLMVKQPIYAEGWHTLAMVRQNMLSNAFSYLPYFHPTLKEWVLIADHQLACFLNVSREDRKQKLAQPLNTIKSEWLKARRETGDCTAAQALEVMRDDGTPLLIIEATGGLAGIITPADLL